MRVPRIVFLILLCLVSLTPISACKPASGDGQPAAKEEEGGKWSFSDEARVASGRDRIPEKLAPQIPQRGIYAAGGGIVSSAWRMVLDLDTREISIGESSAHNASSIGKMEIERKIRPTEEEIVALIKAADAAWREEGSGEPPDPIMDYSELIVIADGEEIFYFDGYGPIRRPLAKALLTMLHEIAREADPKEAVP